MKSGGKRGRTPLTPTQNTKQIQDDFEQYIQITHYENKAEYWNRLHNLIVAHKRNWTIDKRGRKRHRTTPRT
jgi:hypothetical protein